MKAIHRFHDFKHRPTRVTLRDGYFYFYSEGQKAEEKRTKATAQGLIAFRAEDWQDFGALELEADL